MRTPRPDLADSAPASATIRSRSFLAGAVATALLPPTLLALEVVAICRRRQRTRYLWAGSALVVGYCGAEYGLYRRQLRRDGVASGGALGLVPASSGRPARSSVARRVSKRALDLTVSGALLVLLAPCLCVVAVAVKVDDRGPALFRQRRIGRHGRPFTMTKFRTMTVGVEHDPPPSTDADGRPLGVLDNNERDPRVTAIGRVLRRTGLDELPQLINVLSGDMSLVGPRPALPDEVVTFSETLRRRELALPGITGLWQAAAHNDPSLVVYERLDLYYVATATLRTDVALLGWTAGQVVTRIVRTIARSGGQSTGATRPP